ncbi:M1 family metallopeptidase [Pinibacter aurantiacus]|uniref:M1 family metallopeptidase n=1 Tax=Pinibacter aurantiacus TaxID=2851599 RepID=A0A9E2W3N6_9BACT|nr:M1 family metallopeptidase [Pinibacter aurantiacus]MBV4356989.1 M1 family metallopeptidase [Pinibacter aurantiacus]
MRKFFLLNIGFVLMCSLAFAQPDRWQQRVNYKMNIDMDVNTNRFTGTQKLEYTNNSPDTLYKVFYHLYFNAFQPNSMMDMRSRELGKIVVRQDAKGNDVRDWDSRVRDRIANLKPDEIGYQKVLSLKMNGIAQPYKVDETILEVTLTKPILPKSKVVFDMQFEAQVPLQIRRSGRDNPMTGVRYSMSQWYPKMSEYDYEGWHPTPYVAREFYGVWGDYDVTISIDKKYVLGGTGYVINGNQIGYGYEDAGVKVIQPAGNKLSWHFVAPNVHDFMWAADPEYKHLVRKTADGVTINVLYNYKENDTANDAAWNKIADAAVFVLPFIEKHFGKYPYKQYSFVHGGDGGMEYPMSTLISSPSIGTAFHEWMHTWYQMMMGTNESLYPWMDEGFTSWAETVVSQYYEEQTTGNGAATKNELAANTVTQNIHKDAYAGYFALVKSGREEPLTTHADHFESNFGYSIASYSKGEVFMEQLGYIVGAQVRDKILLNYYNDWHFKHPNVNDFIRVAEKTSGMKLDWYKEYWVNTTKTIDYGIDSLWEENGKTKIRLSRIGKVPMPIDLQLTFKNGSKEIQYVPMYLMFGEKPAEDNTPRVVNEAWKWTHPTYVVETNHKITDLKLVVIDPSERMADVNRRNNTLQLNW